MPRICWAGRANPTLGADNQRRRKMRKALVLLAILAFTMAGCCADPTGVSTSKSFTNCMDTVVDWFCANRATIEQQVANAQATINSINSIYGSQIPAAEQTLINDAQQVIAAGQ